MGLFSQYFKDSFSLPAMLFHMVNIMKPTLREEVNSKYFISTYIVLTCSVYNIHIITTCKYPAGTT